MDQFGAAPGSEKTLAAGTLIAGRYRILKPLGTGGMGSVYLAADRLLGDEKIAIKILHTGFVNDETQMARFLREVQLMRKVNHKNVVRTYDVGTDREYNYFTMEFVPGMQLEKLLGPKGVPQDEIVGYATQLCEALQAVHAAGIVHRDLKPGNILVLEDGTLRITDFGVARPEISNLTAHDEIVGSVCYIAPEIWLGKKITASVDLYALGIILYELATGQVPFDGESPAMLMRSHLDKAPTPPKQLNPAVELWMSKLILRLLAKSVNDRPRDAKEVLEYIKLHSGSGSLDQSGAHTTVQPFFEELESKSRILTTIQAADSPNFGRSSQPQLSVVKRRMTQHGSSGPRQSFTAGTSFAEVRTRLFHTAALMGTMSVLTWAIGYALSAYWPQVSELTQKPDLLQQAESLAHLGILAVLFMGIPHILHFVLQMSIPILIVGGAAGSNSHALRHFVSIAIFFTFVFCGFVGYFLWAAPSTNHITGISFLSAMITAKDQLSSVALLSPVTTVYEQIAIGHGLIQSPTAVGPLLGSSIVFASFVAYVGMISFMLSQIVREQRASSTKAPLVLAAVLIVLVTIESSVFRSLLPAPWRTYWQFETRLPSEVLIFSAVHWVLVFIVVLVTTTRLAAHRRSR